MTTGVQLEKSSEPAQSTRKHVWLLLLVILIAAGLVLGIGLWEKFGREFILETVHPFRVTDIDVAAGTMRLVHGNDTYVVRCNEYCRQFQPAKTYPMKEVGAAVEYTGAGQVITLPIVEERTDFDVAGGHG